MYIRCIEFVFDGPRKLTLSVDKRGILSVFIDEQPCAARTANEIAQAVYAGTDWNDDLVNDAIRNAITALVG